jgi:glycine dehydrogenase
MKLNAATEMIPITWPEFNSLHPFVPIDQAKGYQQMIQQYGSTSTCRLPFLLSIGIHGRLSPSEFFHTLSYLDSVLATYQFRLEKDLALLTGFGGVTLQPNAGSQGEYTGLMIIQAYHQSRGTIYSLTFLSILLSSSLSLLLPSRLILRWSLIPGN